MSPAVRLLAALLAGGLFGGGLALSGMINPAIVLGFLDIAGGQWNPNLAAVMIAAIPVAAGLFYLARLTRPANQVPSTPKRQIDWKLIVGAALFGIGWGLAGICPGPALVDVTIDGRFLVFALPMIVGLALGNRLRA